ncbi:MAG: alpha/beta fold hydrolase, partial [Betaproteobacteria bacterium]|nr:alpha/beta fold hydrolase [Betaproteobacteria bacterium]
LKRTLPEYMVPGAWVVLEAFPLTPNGKIDRRALPEPQANLDANGYKVPRDALEQQLLQIWEKLFEVRPIGIGDNFFELGGHSLLAVRLVTEIHQLFGKRLPVIRVFEFPTITGLAHLLRTQGALPKASSLVRIRAKGSRSPIFFLPGAGGIVGYLYALARQLDPEIPFYAFQAQGLDGTSAPHKTVEAMAEDYVRELLDVQPQGPYFLGGHSCGGHVAFAMAQLLLARGHEIGLLAIVDTSAPGIRLEQPNTPIPDDAVLVADVGQLLAQTLNMELTLPPRQLTGIGLNEMLAYFAREFEAADAVPKGTGTEYLRSLVNVYKTHLTMSGQYFPQATRALPIALFRASKGSENSAQTKGIGEDLGWSRYSTQAVQAQFVAGDHISMMVAPHVGALARALQEACVGSPHFIGD